MGGDSTASQGLAERIGEAGGDQPVADILRGPELLHPRHQDAVVVADGAQVDATATRQLLTQPEHSLLLLAGERCHAGQFDGVGAVAVAHQQQAGTAHLEHFSGGGLARSKADASQEQDQGQQPACGAGPQAGDAVQSFAPQLGQKKWALAVVSPQEPHWRWVSIASSGWLGRPTIWALLAPGGTMG